MWAVLTRHGQIIDLIEDYDESRKHSARIVNNGWNADDAEVPMHNGYKFCVIRKKIRCCIGTRLLSINTNKRNQPAFATARAITVNVSSSKTSTRICKWQWIETAMPLWPPRDWASTRKSKALELFYLNSCASWAGTPFLNGWILDNIHTKKFNRYRVVLWIWRSDSILSENERK